MSDLNWKNANDYAYTAKLTDAGWAWEFIRRSETYRTAYKAMKPEDFKRTVPQGLPPHFLSSAEAKEAMNYTFRMPLELSQRKAGAWWMLDMYDPATVYDPDKIHFRTNNEAYPVIYGPLLETIGHVSPHPVSDVSNIDSFQMGPTTLAVFVDFSRDVMSQVKSIKDVLQVYAEVIPDSVYGKRKQPAELWTRYLRMLDAREDTTLSGPEKISRIDPQKIWKPKGSEKGKTYGIKDADSSELSKYADDTLQKAEQMAEEGFRFLLKSV